MSESSLWAYLQKGMKRYWTATRHEDKLTPGIPDVSFCCQGTSGWVELKFIPSWPQGKNTSVKLNLSLEQRLWLKERLNHGNNVWVLLQVQREYLLFKGNVIENLGTLSQEEMITRATGYWQRRINFTELREILIKEKYVGDQDSATLPP